MIEAMGILWHMMVFIGLFLLFVSIMVCYLDGDPERAEPFYTFGSIMLVGGLIPLVIWAVVITTLGCVLSNVIL